MRRRGDTPSLWRARLAPWRALLAPGCGLARGSGVCVRWLGGRLVPLPPPSAPCPSVPFRRPAMPAYPLCTRWVGLGWTVGLGGLTWCFFPAGRRGLGSFWGRVARVVCRAACTVSWASWFLFTGVHALCVVLRVRCPGPLGSCSPVCALCVWCCVYGVLGLLAPVHQRACPVCGVACTVSGASWLLFTGVRAPCVVLCARCPVSLGSCSPVCAFCVWCCVYGVLGLLAPVHRCARSVCGVVCTVSWASWLLFTGVHALCVVLRVWCPGPLGYCSPVCTLCVWCCVYDVLGLLAPVHRCARSVCGVACTMPWASLLLFTGVHVLCVVLRVRCPGPPGSCSPVCTPCSVVLWVRYLGLLGYCSPACTLCVRCCLRSVLGRLALVHRCACFGVLCPVYGVLGPLAPVHRCARSVCGVVCVVSWAFWPLFAGVLVWCVSCCVCGVPGHLVRVLRCCGVLRCVWCSVCGVACAVSWASRPLFTGAHARYVVLCGRCPGLLGSCSPVWLCGVLCGGFWCPGSLGSQSPVCLCCVLRGVCGVPGHLAPIHRCARVACVVLRVRCPGPRGSCSPACCVLVRCVVCCARCPRPRGSCSRVCLLGVLRCACGVGVDVCSRVPYRPRCIFRRAEEYAPSVYSWLRHRGERRSELATAVLAKEASCILRSLTYSSRPGLFVFGDAEEYACLIVCMAVYAIYSLVCVLFVFCDAQE